MKGGSAPERGEAIEIRSGGMWGLWFVAAALVSLAAIPVYMGSRVDDVEDRITDILLPASNLSSRLSLLNSRQMARFEGFVLSGDGSFRLAYTGAIADTDSVYARLGRLARDLDLEVRERLAQLSARTTQWNLENQIVFGEDEAELRRAALGRSRQTFADLQRSTELLDAAIQSEVRAGRRRMDQARTLQSRITLALAGLALFATLSVARVGRRLRSLTLEAERRRREAVRARREMDALLEATGDGVLGIDLEGRCISLNRTGADLLGFREGELRGRSFHDTLHHSFDDGTPRPSEGSPLLEGLRSGAPRDSGGVDVIRCKDGTDLPVQWALRPLIDGNELRGAVLTFTDMTEIRRKERELREAIQRREDVVSIVSHDLRNPLGVIFGATDILLELPLDESGRKRQAEIIGRAAKRMSNLIEDLLDVARIEDGAFVVRRSLEDVREVVEEAAQLFRDQARAKGLRLDVVEGDGKVRARLDRDRLLQALANLLDNAIRLTPEGGRVTLSAERVNGRVHVRVSDTGTGVDPDELDHLFDRFWRRDDGVRRSGGLGLTIVKGVVEAHGGEIHVHSVPGVGTTFTLDFPAAAPEATVEERE